MTAQKPLLTPEEATTVLAANAKNLPDDVTAALRQVASGQPLETKQREILESIVAEGKAKQNATATAREADPKDRPEKKIGRNGKKRERDLAVHARRLLILDMRFRHPPVPMRQIAKDLNISTNTVVADMNAIRRDNAELLSGNAGRDLLGETLARYELIAGKAMTMAEDHKGTNAKARFLRTATDALEAKTRLALDAGVIRKAPTKIEASGPEGAPIPVADHTPLVRRLTLQERLNELRQARAARQAPPAPAAATPPAPQPAPPP